MQLGITQHRSIVGRVAAFQPRKSCFVPRARSVAPLTAQSQKDDAPSTSTASFGAQKTLMSLALWALTEAPAHADTLPGAPPASSYYVSLGLFVLTVPGARKKPLLKGGARRQGAILVADNSACKPERNSHKCSMVCALVCLSAGGGVMGFFADARGLVAAHPNHMHPAGPPPPRAHHPQPHPSLRPFHPLPKGLWSLIKRSPKAKIKRKTFEVAGPAKEGAVPLDARAREIFAYFKKYNYSVKSTGEVIVFEGNYQASAGECSPACRAAVPQPHSPSTRIGWCNYTHTHHHHDHHHHHYRHTHTPFLPTLSFRRCRCRPGCSSGSLHCCGHGQRGPRSQHRCALWRQLVVRAHADQPCRGGVLLQQRQPQGGGQGAWLLFLSFCFSCGGGAGGGGGQGPGRVGQGNDEGARETMVLLGT
jgi:hypothetical protein